MVGVTVTCEPCLHSVAQPFRAAYGFAVATSAPCLGGRGVATLDSHRQLGRSGLLVSPLALGTMTFGWGADRDTARAIFTAYVEAGGNFVDTANGYAEEMVGAFANPSARSW